MTAWKSQCLAMAAPSLSLLQWKRVKQGCVIAPTLFAIFIAAILHLIGEELLQGIPIMYRTDGRLFNLNRFKAKSKVNCTTITELQYTDNKCYLRRRPPGHSECFCKGVQSPGPIIKH